MNKFRLPTTAAPTNYNLTLSPDIEAAKFDGTIKIDVAIQEATSEIVLNAKDLNIETVEISTSGDLSVAEWKLEAEAETLTVVLSEQLPAEAEAQLEIRFTGTINEKLVGFYISEYTHGDSVEKIASTQFEAPHARRCFPCWDEPSFKATFEITLIVDEELDAISNGQEVSSKALENGKKEVTFAPTIPLSTYLVAFVIGRLEFSETVDVDGVKIRIAHRPGRGGLNDFALKVASFSLRYLTEYFGISYQGSKIDFIAIPDFEMGAMENQGCITFRESALLIDEKLATQPELQRTADVIAHELAHMWFGNLVTMKWWNGLWLNEAFATFMELKTVDAMFPAWERWADFTISRAQAFAVDATTSTRPIEFKVDSPADAEGMFDILTYEKGASLVRMLEQHVGEDAFREGLRLYMDQNKFANTDTDALWDSVQEATTEPVAEMMKSWIFQPGFPIVTSKIEGNKLTLSQSRANYAQTNPADTLWDIPLGYSTFRGTEPVVGKLTMTEATQQVMLPDDTEQVLLNTESNSFVKISYSTELLETHADRLDLLSSVERFSLIDDAWSSVLGNTMSAVSFVTLLEAFAYETSRPVWSRIIQGLGDIKHLLSGEARDNFARLAHDLIQPKLKSLGMTPVDGEEATVTQLRGDLIHAMGVTAQDPEVQAEAQRTLSVLLRDPELVDPAIASAVIAVSARCGDAADFDNLVEAWRSATNPQDEQRYLFALPQFPDAPEINKLLEMLREKQIRSQSAPYLLRSALHNREHAATVWNFIQDNWEMLSEYLGDASKPRMLDGVTRIDHTGDTATQAIEFLEKIELRVGSKSLDQTLERLNVQLLVREREAQRLNAYFAD